MPIILLPPGTVLRDVLDIRAMHDRSPGRHREEQIHASCTASYWVRTSSNMAGDCIANPSVCTKLPDSLSSLRSLQGSTLRGLLSTQLEHLDQR